MKKILLILISILIISLIGIASYFLLTSKKSGYDESQFVVPDAVGLYLGAPFQQSGDDKLYPVLTLQIYAGGGCDKVSDLEILKASKEGTMFVTIKGYSITKYQGFDDCISVVTEARSQINIDNFLKSGGHQIWFSLNNKESQYRLLRDRNAIYLEPMDVTNVISHSIGINMPKDPQFLAVILQPEKFARLGFNGTSYTKIDYRSLLKQFAYSKNLTPVDEIYRGFKQDNMQSLWVIAEDSQIPKTIPAIIGNITYDAEEVNSHSIDVAIRREAPFNVYSY